MSTGTDTSRSTARNYRETVATTWRENLLFSVLVELTYRCNLDCYFCYNDLNLTGREMNVEDYGCFFGDLASLGCLHLTLTGGEPTAHPNFFEIGAAARRFGFVIRVKSNGHALRGRTLERLQSEVDPFAVDISLHGACAETHDRQTRVPGSFDRLMTNLELMKGAGLRIKLNTTLTRWNETEAELEGMRVIAERFGCAHSISPDVTPRDDGDPTPLAISASHEARQRLLGLGSDVKIEHDAEIPSTDDQKHCGAGSSGIAIDPFGNVFPCVQWRRPVGNLHESSIKEIWLGNSRLQEIRALTTEVKRRGAPPWFCPGAAELEKGSPFPGGASLPLHPGGEGRLR